MTLGFKAKRVLIAGIVAGIVSFLVSTALFFTPMVSEIYDAFPTGTTKEMVLFGSSMNWLAAMLLGGVVFTVFIAALYAYAEKALPAKAPWKKGLCFGFLLWLVTTIPAAFTTFMVRVYPEALIPVEAAIGLISALITGMVLAIEPMVNMGGYEVFFDDDDKWTVRTVDGLPSAHFEHTVAITENGVDILTDGLF